MMAVITRNHTYHNSNGDNTHNDDHILGPSRVSMARNVALLCSDRARDISLSNSAIATMIMILCSNRIHNKFTKKMAMIIRMLSMLVINTNHNDANDNVKNESGSNSNRKQ